MNRSYFLTAAVCASSAKFEFKRKPTELGGIDGFSIALVGFSLGRCSGMSPWEVPSSQVVYII